MQHSRVMESEGRIVSAALITYWHQRPLLAYAMTLPDYQQQGFGRSCIQHAMQSLFEAHYPALSLVVTIGNTPAMQLYKPSGFMETPE